MHKSSLPLIATYIAIALAILQLTGCEVGFTDQEVAVKIDEASNSLVVLVIYRGIFAAV